MTKPRVPAAKEGIPSERTASETTALLVELGRAVKARSFYAATEPEVRLLFSRAWRSVQADLRRFGALEIEAAPAWLRVPGLALRVPNVQLGGLPQRMADRGRAHAALRDGALERRLSARSSTSSPPSRRTRRSRSPRRSTAAHRAVSS